MDKEYVITLPKLVGSRESAKDYCKNINTNNIVVDMTTTKAGTQSFADELVNSILYVNDDTVLTVINPTKKLHEEMGKSAVRRGVRDRLHFE